MVLLLGARAGWAQNYTANFTTSPAGCGEGTTGCESFQVTLGGVVYVFAFAPDNGGGSFKHYTFGGVDNGPAMELESRRFDSLSTERVTITRLDGGLFNAVSIYVDNFNGKPITLQPFVGASPVGNAQTVPTKGKQTVFFGGSSVTSILLTSRDFYQAGLDDFTVCVAASVSFNAAGVCLGAATSFTNTSTSVLPGATYEWDFNSDNVIDATIANPSYTYPAAGDYTAKLTIRQGGCVSSATKAIKINTRPTATLSGGGTFCTGGQATLSIDLTGTAPWSVTYTDGTTPVTRTNILTSPLIVDVTPATSKTYTLTAVSNVTCTGTFSGSAPVTVNALPAIANQPAGATTCVGGSVTFNVGATGTGLGYQWKKNGVNIPQATGSAYSLNNLAVADAAEYTVEVSGTCSPAVMSEKAVLVVNQAPVISGQPVNEEVCVGSNASFSVTATNATGYQWQVNMGSGFVNVSNNAIYSGATTGTLNVAGAPANLNGYQYQVLVNGSCTPPTSDVVALTVNTPPVITAGPAGVTKCVGEQATFSVTATGTDVTYQWKKNGTNIPGATSSTFSVSSASVGDAGSYTVVVSGVCSAPVTSASAVLVVNQAPVLTSQPVNEEICAGSNASFNVGASNATDYQWQVNTGSGFVNLFNNAVYSGATTGTLDITGATASMDGYQYRLVVTGACPPVVTSHVSTLAVSTSASIVSVTVSGTQCAGGAVNFSVAATGTDLSYQWKKNGTNIPGATSSTYNIASTVVGDAGTYTVVVSTACGSPAVSSPSELVISVPPTLTSQPTPVAICTGSNASFSAGASNATSYQWQVNTGSGFANLANGGVYSGVNTATLLITGATTALNGYQYRAIASGTCPPVATSTAATLSVGNPTALGSFTPLAGPVLIGTSVKMTIGFTGSAPGTAVWNWNDGTTSNGMIGNSTITGNHVYATPGVYTPTLTVNSCGGSASASYEYVVIYDPNGGFITGSGWFNSPAGAYRPQPSLEGRVNFGFVSKYKKGTTVPNGRTEFLYRMGNLSFNSTAYEWLVISGAKGQYKGSGTINGTGNYGFILTAIDGGKRPDRLRMKIWNKANNALVYDNQFGAGDTADPTTVINGGSIMIKAPSKSGREGFDTAEAGAVLSSGPSAYPNPFRDRVTVDLSGLKPGIVRLDLTDGQGHSVHRQDVELKRNQSAVELELGDLKPGMYLLQARGNGDGKLIKLIKL